MEVNFIEVFQKMAGPAMAVAVVLFALGLASLTVFVERILTLWRSRAASRAFTRKAADDLNAGNFDAVISASGKYKRGHLARIVKTGLSTYRHAEKTAEVSGLTPFDQTQRYMERYMEEVSADLRRGLAVLASTGSVAPFVGLLGTVLGIIAAFQGIAATGSGGLAAVSAGIAEALVETALGLAVAIPAVLAFNYLSGRIGREEILLKNAAGELLDTNEDRAERAEQAAENATRPRPATAAR
jgi:biopolymer transport protein ExbB